MSSVAAILGRTVTGRVHNHSRVQKWGGGWQRSAVVTRPGNYLGCGDRDWLGEKGQHTARGHNVKPSPFPTRTNPSAHVSMTSKGSEPADWVRRRAAAGRPLQWSPARFAQGVRL